MLDQTFIDLHNILFIHKRKFHIDLCKFRLTVRTQILITEAFCNLDISVVSGAHQKLLKQLW